MAKDFNVILGEAQQIKNEIDITYTWGTAATTNSLKTTNIVIESYW